MNKRDGNPSSEHILAMITNLMMMIDWYGIVTALQFTVMSANKGKVMWQGNQN
ncbi:transmembrane protein, putative [Medicago truncatula]|uniref:Transmembrane protein, putative n=1 Tax=Medicago truncatula TaxID=3880 RepID=A0A072TL77_MEDTR|nr:transmembrane protein, putative [Medicago truncatula]